MEDLWYSLWYWLNDPIVGGDGKGKPRWDTLWYYLNTPIGAGLVLMALAGFGAGARKTVRQSRRRFRQRSVRLREEVGNLREFFLDHRRDIFNVRDSVDPRSEDLRRAENYDVILRSSGDGVGDFID